MSSKRPPEPRPDEVPSLYAYVQDVGAEWETFLAVHASLADQAPPGMVLRLAGPTADGFRVMEVWESRQDWERFRETQLRPAVRAVPGDAPDRPAVFLDLATAYAVFSPRCPAPGPGQQVPSR